MWLLSLLSYLLPFSRTFNCTKTTGSPKELKLIPTCPTLTKVLPKVAHAFLYTLMDFFSRTKLWLPLLSYLLPFSPERSIALVKRLVHQRSFDPNLPHANKSVTCCSTRILIYIDGLLQSHQTVAKPLLSYLLPFSRTFNCTSKTTGSPKELKLIRTCPTLTKVLLQGSTRILIYID
jgi:hypothetical protein